MNILCNERGPDESFENYKQRRKLIKQMVKNTVTSTSYFLPSMNISTAQAGQIKLKAIQHPSEFTYGKLKLTIPAANYR
jgi:hypothetical protein